MCTAAQLMKPMTAQCKHTGAASTHKVFADYDLIYEMDKMPGPAPSQNRQQLMWLLKV
jgi:hypothetical protein